MKKRIYTNLTASSQVFNLFSSYLAFKTSSLKGKMATTIGQIRAILCHDLQVARLDGTDQVTPMNISRV